VASFVGLIAPDHQQFLFADGGVDIGDAVERRADDEGSEQMVDITEAAAATAGAPPSAAVRALDRLVGRWDVRGGASGSVASEGPEGGWFLEQEVDLDHGGDRTTGIELTGHDRDLFAAASDDIRSGSPAFYRGTFSADRSTLRGESTYPGGGYSSVVARVAWEGGRR
jgi:hypothetical protein